MDQNVQHTIRNVHSKLILLVCYQPYHPEDGKALEEDVLFCHHHMCCQTATLAQSKL